MKQRRLFGSQKIGRKEMTLKRGRPAREIEDIPFMARDLEHESKRYVFNVNNWILNKQKKSRERLQKAVTELYLLAFDEKLPDEKAKALARKLEEETR
jgi:hypothetical protein